MVFGWLKKTRSALSPRGPDWSHVDTRAKADALVASGALVQLQLLPEAFGGDRRAPNMSYVPPFVVEIKERIDSNTVMPLVHEGKVQRYVARPKYQGSSQIPISIEIHATEPASFTASIAIWGEALEDNAP